MSETITPQRFHEVDWRVVRSDACAHFRTESFVARPEHPIGELHR